MIKIGILVLTLSITACSKTVEAPIEMVETAEKLCAVANAKPEVLSGRLWFPTFASGFYIRCKREDMKEKIEYTVRLVK